MLDRRGVFLKALLLVLLAICSWADDDDDMQYDLTKETWQKIQQLCDISRDVESVLQKYNGENGDDCRQQLPQQNYRASLDKKLAFYKGKLIYADKMLKSDILKCGSSDPCKEECEARHESNMDSTLTNAKVTVPPIKQAAIKGLKTFMDSCTSGDLNTEAQDKAVSKRSFDEDQPKYGRISYEDHW